MAPYRIYQALTLITICLLSACVPVPSDDYYRGFKAKDAELIICDGKPFQEDAFWARNKEKFLEYKKQRPPLDQRSQGYDYDNKYYTVIRKRKKYVRYVIYDASPEILAEFEEQGVVPIIEIYVWVTFHACTEEILDAGLLGY